MSQHDRGAYTPQTDAPLAFDARAPRGGRRPLPMALIGSGLVLLVMVVAVVMYYRSGVRPEGGAPKPVGEPVTAMRSPPALDAQPADPAANLDVYAAQNVPTTAPAFAPTPEQPAPRPPPQAGLRVQTVDPNPVHAVPTPAAPPAATPAPAPRQMAQAQPAPVATPAPAATTAPRTVAQAQPAPSAAAAPRPATAAVATTAPRPAAAPPAPAAGLGGPAAVQIGAYSSTALADRGYSEVAAAFPGPMAGKSKRVEPLSRDGKTLYRGLIGGFASKSAAQAFCDTLKAAGRTCLVRG